MSGTALLCCSMKFGVIILQCSAFSACFKSCIMCIMFGMAYESALLLAWAAMCGSLNLLKLYKMSYEIKPTVSTLGCACACAVAVTIVSITKYHCYICAAGKMEVIMVDRCAVAVCS